MRKIFISITLTFSLIAAKAQQQTITSSKTIAIDRKSLEQKIVKDTTGAILPYEQWHPLMVSGGYMLRGKGMQSDTLELVKLSVAQKAARSTMLAKLPAAALPQSPAFPVGEKKDLVNARDINGDKVDFKALQGKVIVLNFWFINCVPCRQEIPELNKLVADNPDVAFIAMGLDLKYEIKDFIKETPFNYRQIYDARDLTNGYGVHSYPTNVVIDKKGVTRYSSAGFGNGGATFLKKAIEEAKAEN